MIPLVETDFLVVGAGPAGAAMGCFLGQNGMKGIVISGASGTAETPRAHLVSPFAIECFRDIGLEDDARRMAITGTPMSALRWVRSITGEEYAKNMAWGRAPTDMAQTRLATPCEHLDLPQAWMEPLLIKYATHNGFEVRFRTEFVSATRDDDDGSSGGHHRPLVCTLRDGITNTTYQVRTRFLIGGDGARSHVARAFGFPFDKPPPHGVACNVLVRADMNHLLVGRPERHAQITFIVRPEEAMGPRTPAGILRMVRAWKEWLYMGFSDYIDPGSDANASIFHDPAGYYRVGNKRLEADIRKALGAEAERGEVDVEVVRVDPWVSLSVFAKEYALSSANHFKGGVSAERGEVSEVSEVSKVSKVSKSESASDLTPPPPPPILDVFIAGDAAHRHPPAYGLGSNTCIQDAYNLAWKLALVTRGLAGRSLLASYSAERQPVGERLVHEASSGMKSHMVALGAFGLFQPDGEAGARHFASLSAGTAEGAANREALCRALDNEEIEGRSLGMHMNQWYDAPGAAVCRADEPGARPPLAGDFITTAQIGTYPGTRLPHAWLSKRGTKEAGSQGEVSTHDVVGHGRFVVLTGNGGEGWIQAAKSIGEKTGIPITGYGIGFGMDYQDVYRWWRANRGVEDSGCVLVRPDRFVAWRAREAVEDCEGKLMKVLDKILSRDEL